MPKLPGGRVARIGLARWSGSSTGQPLEMSSDHVDDSHFITYSLRQADVHFSIGSQRITTGTVLPQRVLLQGPTSQRRQSIYRGSFDFFRVYFSQELLAECFEAVHDRYPSSEIVLFDPHFVEDRILENLTRSLISVDEDGGPLGPTFVDGVGLALVARLIGHHSGRGNLHSEKRPAPLPKWRLNRAIAYIEARLTEPIYLAELSSAAGLSRMHFAAQFRAAMGCTPHTYILRRRIAGAQQLLLDRAMSIAEVSLVMGFQNQAHFTTVFKRIVGDTPGRWRTSIAC